MNDRFLRVYKKFDITEVKEHLLIYGDLSAQCAHCQAMDLKLDTRKCPKCGAEFTYIAFRNVRNHMPKLQKISETHPSIQLIDFEDYHREMGAQKARDFLK